ncbi:MAG TPA: molybdopterin-guanine dinucleotide biosynthesis protein B [Arenicellales bacterium]|nr:molybdopterin-guanine dinucleotide biosynthesis protein B [Arenicellales bacterium]
MKRVHIVGGKNHGKTGLVTDLIREFDGRGLRVGTIKYTHHQHELDTPGKDSHRHREAGATVVGVMSRSLDAVFLPERGALPAPQRYAGITPMFEDCDLVVVEGDRLTDAAKIEVWRAAAGTRPLATDDPAILAVVTDDPVDIQVPRLPRSDVSTVADWLLVLIAGIPEPRPQ